MFYSRIFFPEKVMQIEHKIPIQNSIFLGVRGLTFSFCRMCDYTVSGDPFLWSIYLLCIYIYIYIHVHVYSKWTFLYNIFIYFQCFKNVTDSHSSQYSSDKTVVVLLHTLVPDLALSVILSLSCIVCFCCYEQI